ncbi:DUF192 domain-containing protein [Ectothiorhodosinus mongolicus]|uniref:DUF192 domain-containing protein n=1 Tax=Ectothiorhodosinus mongolicus TaxID=233100 RepID=UPI001F3BFE01|nr:DUF192 domain-containing protein [Ectothiorhodosinus mongolicus]
MPLAACNKINIRRWLVALVLAWTLAPAAWAGDLLDPPPQSELTWGDRQLQLELALTPEWHARGLMYRNTLAEHQGMLFIWPDAQRVAMWMKNTPIPLSVAFIDAEFRVVNIADMQPQSLRSHVSRGPVRFALEMNQGWFTAQGIQAGDTWPELAELIKALDLTGMDVGQRP